VVATTFKNKGGGTAHTREEMPVAWHGVAVGRTIFKEDF